MENYTETCRSVIDQINIEGDKKEGKNWNQLDASDIGTNKWYQLFRDTEALYNEEPKGPKFPDHQKKLDCLYCHIY